MPISGLIVSLAGQADARERAIDAICAEPLIEVGVVEAQRMSIVVDTATSEEDKRVWDWLQALPGVIFVDVVMVGFEDDNHGAVDSSQGRLVSPGQQGSFPESHDEFPNAGIPRA